MRRIFLVLILPVFLAACGAAEPVWAPDEAVQKALYRSGEPTSISLYTMVSNSTGKGEHSGLLINGAHRVMFDPAGTFGHSTVPERNDVHYGITPRVLEHYIDYHARETYHVVVQTVEVSPEIAALAMRVAQDYGAVPKAHCTNSITTVLGQIPGFQSIKHTWWPTRAMKDFGNLPGVQTQRIYDDSPDDRSDVAALANNG
ncbi:hypothetical protein IV417_11585 [Alphaproteobacteria bacterium KMM 3653]|uniref:Lipoprotein n=1 Tax=Harenicola maris TaxID=2841044 RepID=A0AAP2CPM1_9RHOB|nr:hypothetical protein [Harenicola maris]